MAGDADAAIRRVLAALAGGEALAVLGEEVSGTDLTTFLLEVLRRRAAGQTPAAVMRRASTNRLVEPGTVDGRALHRVIATVIAAVPTTFEFLELAPVAPLGTHSVMATVHQHKVVATVRGTEVAADPTNALAIVAARRRQSQPQAQIQRLAAVQRILRAQPFGDQGQAHFSVVGLVTAGRDRGNLDFERDAIIEQLHVLVAAVKSVTNAAIDVRMTSLRDEFTEALIDDARALITDATVTTDPDRVSGRGYYRDLCFKVLVGTGPARLEVGDGGFTDWTQQLVGSRKERLLISGLGMDRLTSLAT